MGCKGPYPTNALYMTSSLSFAYALFSTIGHILIILAIVIDPHKVLRKRLNLWLLNIAVADMVVATVVNGYRMCSNYIQACGLNVSDYISDKTMWSKICHVNLIGVELIVLGTLFAVFTDQLCQFKFHIKLNKRNSYRLLGLVSAGTWVVGFGYTGLYFIYGFGIMEFATVTISFVGALIGLVSTYLVLYLPAVTDNADNHAESTKIALDLRSKSPTDKQETVEAFSAQPTNDSDTSDVKGSNPAIIKVFPFSAASAKADVNDEEHAEEVTATVRLQYAKALLLTFALLCLCAGSAFILIYLIFLKKDLPCLLFYWMKHFRMMLVISDMALNPFCLILFWPNLSRGILGVLKLRKRQAVAPAFE